MTPPLRHAAMLLLLVATLPVWADTYTVRGAAACEEWKGDPSDRGWVMGYISGYNASQSGNLTEGMKNDEVVEQVGQICRDDPSQDFDDAVQVFIGRLLRARDASAAPPAGSK